jgi:hypothetical protein
LKVTYPSDEEWELLNEAAEARIEKMSVREFEQIVNGRDHYRLAGIIQETASRMAEQYTQKGEW